VRPEGFEPPAYCSVADRARFDVVLEGAVAAFSAEPSEEGETFAPAPSVILELVTIAGWKWSEGNFSRMLRLVIELAVNREMGE
jgi:hypothetical protein